MSDIDIIDVAGDTDEHRESSITKTCISCGRSMQFMMTHRQYVRWKQNGEYVQDVFRHLSKELREQMISGTHPECWKDLFGIDEDDLY